MVEMTLFRDRPDWEDVTPIDLDEDPEPVIKIAYSESFRDAFSYLRGVIHTGELSERVFELTTFCVGENPSCYTVWLLRRKLIKHLKKDIREELNFMTLQITNNQKNYQVWYHRQKLIEWLKNPEGELEFIDEMLREDAKNYHAWQYRQWLLTTFGHWDQELTTCDRMLHEDCRNNSVWNQRYFVIGKTSGFDGAIVEREIEYTINMIRKVSRNESAWNYLKGIWSHADPEQRKLIVRHCERLRDTGEHNVFLYAALLDMYEDLSENAKAKEIVGELIRVDAPRKGYWLFRDKLLVVP